MNWDRIAGTWHQWTGKLQERWGKFTDDDLRRINGSRDQLVGRIQEHYGLAREESERQVDQWQAEIEQNEYGEGNYKASREYNKAAHDFVETGRVQEAAARSAPQTDAEARELDRAEQIGRSHMKEEDPAVREPTPLKKN
jgi:uncharacterized protein YjbJ (UPF0337 family)